MKYTVWVAGASGLVGRALVKRLAAHPAYDNVIALVRAPAPELDTIEGLIVHQVDFQKLRDTLPGGAVHHVYSALGSTRAKTPHPDDFRTVDVLHPLTIAKAAQAAGASGFAVVSAPGAHAFSRIKYLQLKGELDNRLQAMDFGKLVIAQPGLLLGERAEQRTGEDWLARQHWLHPLLPKRLRPIAAETVADALIGALTDSQHGVRWLDNVQMAALVKS